MKKYRKRGLPPEISVKSVTCNVPDLVGPCYIFTGRQDGKGYGCVDVGDKVIRVHRYVWERDIGPIPPGLVIDHQCRNRACCNVLHLRVVTRAINAMENSESPVAKHTAQTRCKRGHEFTKSNTYRYRTRRVCRECNRTRRQREKTCKAL